MHQLTEKKHMQKFTLLYFLLRRNLWLLRIPINKGIQNYYVSWLDINSQGATCSSHQHVGTALLLQSIQISPVVDISRVLVMLSAMPIIK